MDITPFRNILNEMYSADVSVKIKSAPRPLRLPPGWNPALAQVLYGPGGLGALPAGEGLILRYSAGAVLS